MKKTDIAMIILIASVSVIAAYFIVGAIPMLSNVNKPVSVPTINEYSANVGDPDKTIFYKGTLNPTVQITIGNGNSPAPSQ